MSKYAITSGTIAAPVKTVLYGPEGIGKSTFAAQFPAPVFIDTEGGTKRLNVARLPAPTSWAMLLDEVAEVSRGNVPCGTLVIDTADWAERLCIDAVCARASNNGKHRPLTARLSHLFRAVRGGDHHYFPVHRRTPSQHINTITLDGTGSKEKLRMSNL